MTDPTDMAAAPPRGVIVRLWNAPYLLLTLVALFWAGNALVGRASRDVIPPLTLAFARWSGALILVLPFALRHLPRDLPALKAKAPVMLLLGFLGIALFNALLYSGLHLTSATNGVLIQAGIPPMIVLLAYLLFRETVGWRQLAAVVLSMAGVAVVVGEGSARVLMHLKIGAGDLLVLCAVAVWALYTVLLRLRPAVHPMSFLVCIFAVGVSALAPACIVELTHGHRVVWGVASLSAIAYVAVFPSLIAYLLYNRGIDLLGSARAGQFINLMPLFGAGLAVLLLGEPLRAYHLVGGVLIIAGVAGFAAAPARTPLVKNGEIV